ncbi:unnamed protein product [Phytomonas sp. Hart1]|nr:unnamed protein product [Phytomonas sp. Hart1]|eukprot:CCW66945.1 unnamed protein product [Phytomonas sp. isolate Hart1]
MLFSGVVFLVPPIVCSSTIAIIYKHGGHVVYTFDDSVTCGIQAASAIDESCIKSLEGANDNAQRMQRYLRLMQTLNSFPSIDEFRHNRLFIVYECWVVESALLGQRLPLHPLDTQHVAYHPFSMHGLSFTTSQLPRSIKANVVAALQSCGAHYTPHLDGRTQLVVYSRLLGSGGTTGPQPRSVQWCAIEQPSGEVLKRNSPKFQEKALLRVEGSCSRGAVVCDREDVGSNLGMHRSKWDIAQVARIPCVTPSWVELCVRLGRRLPLTSEVSCTSFISALLHASSVALPKRPREERLFYGDSNSEQMKLAR